MGKSHYKCSQLLLTIASTIVEEMGMLNRSKLIERILELRSNALRSPTTNMVTGSKKLSASLIMHLRITHFPIVRLPDLVTSFLGMMHCEY